MPTFAFKGFNTGSAVALSVAQGGNTEAASIPAWGQGNLGSIDILTVAPPVITAPSGVWFEAIQIQDFNVSGPGPGEVYDPSFHEITYIWTVRGQPLPAFSAPGNMVTGWNNPNLAYGRKIAFHFAQPGTYTIDLWAVDSDGTTATAETTVTVVDADTMYPGAQTVCFSNQPGETWSGEKPNCQRATTFGQLQTAVNNATAPLRILFKRGQTVTRQEVARVRVNGAGDWMNHIGTWGSGAKPVVHCRDTNFIFVISGNAASNPVDQLTIENIAFRGGWNAASETGVDSDTPFNFIFNPEPCHYTFSQCEFDGMAIVWFGVNDRISYVTIADCVRTNWRDYGFFFHNATKASYALLGCRVAQNVDAGNGAPNGEGKNGLYNDHGPLRYGSIGHMYMSCCDFFSRNGWFDGTDQPCLRLNTDGDEGVSTILDRVVCEGGNVVVSFKGNTTSTQEKPGNHLIDRALLIATAMTFETFVRAEYGGLTVRNSIGIYPNVPGYKPNTWSGGVHLLGDLAHGPNLAEEVRVYCNTFMNFQNTANDPGHSWAALGDSEGFTNKIVENNVLHAPGLDSPVTAPAPLDLSTPIGGVTPRYKGVHFNEFGQENGTFSSSIGNNGSFTLPYPAGTNQSYWQAIQSTDTQHRIRISNNTYHAERADFTVTYQASSVRITNTSGTNWSGTWQLRLDRKSLRSPIPATYASPATLPLPRPVSAIGSGQGLISYADFETNPRGATPSTGAVNP